MQSYPWLPEGYRERLESFSEKLNREFFLQGSGQKEDLELAPLYAEYSGLYAPEFIARLKSERESGYGGRHAVFPSRLPAGDAERSLDNLYAFALENHFGKATAAEMEELEAAKARARVRAGDEEASFHGAAVRILQEPDPARRRLWFEGRMQVMESLQPLQQKRWRRNWSEARALGCRDYRSLWSEALAVEHEALEASLLSLQRETDSLYEELLTALAPRIGMKRGDLSPADISFLQAMDHRKAFFRTEALVPALTRTLRGMGIDLAGQKNILIDIEPRPGKSARAFCTPIRVPQEVTMVVLPSGQASDCSTLFHEMGHVQHFANTSASLPAERRVLCDRALTEGYAFLLQYIVMASPSWAREMLGLDDPAYFEETAFVNLYALRRYTAKLRYERVLHAEGCDLGAMPETYHRFLEEATRVPVRREAYLEDVDEGFYSADYLRAWLFEAHMREKLMSKFGRRWWASEAAGNFLKDMWSTGGTYRAEEMARELGIRDLDPEAWLSQLKAQLQHARGAARY